MTRLQLSKRDASSGDGLWRAEPRRQRGRTPWFDGPRRRMVMSKVARRSAAVLLVLGTSVAAAPSTSPTGTMPATTSTVSVVAMGSSNCTSLFCFKPQVVKTVNNGTVRWSNNSGVTHTITRCTPGACSGQGGGTGTDGGFGTATLQANQHYAFRFDAPGTYLYYCAIHGYGVMHGTVAVH